MPEFEEILHDKIDNYLTGRMTATEKSDFEAKIAGDPLLQEEVEFQKKVMGAVKYARKQELKDYIKTSARAENRKKFTRPMWLSAAAAILIITMVGIFYFRNENQNEVHLAEQKDMFEAPPAPADVLSDSGKVSTDSEEIKTENGNSVSEMKPSYNASLKNALIKDTVLYATIIESEKDEEIDRVAGGTFNADDKVKVELYKVGEDGAGYIFFNNKLKIYSFVTDVERIDLKHFENNLYMGYGLEIYQLIPQNKLNKFVPVRNERILRKISVKMNRSN